jgi:DNA-binding GntR family transcriptional regulator
VNSSRRVTVVSGTAETRIVEILRQRILAGELVGGDRLRQLDVSEELGVSTTPVREAFRSLAAEGLLQIDSHRGAVVREMTPAELLEIYQLQLLVERDNLAYALPRMGEDDLAAAQAAQDAMRQTRDAVDWALLNRDFHLALALPAGRPRVHRLLSDLLNLTAVQIRSDIDNWTGRRRQALAEHDRMLEAARTGVIEEAAAALTEHTSAPIRNLESVLGQTPLTASSAASLTSPRSGPR